MCTALFRTKPSSRIARAPARPLLDALRADRARYVQFSVGNWLNDVAKDNPGWVRAIADDWGRNDPATARILARGLRSLAR
jgi:3-methyladenine DNA glycosylase AlkC